MSLLGRLEDLSLADIIQIVYLSRRTGVLEVLHEDVRHTIVFRNGLVVNATSPEAPHVPVPLHEESIRGHIMRVIGPLLQSRGGEFNFLLSDDLPPEEIGYDPELLLAEGGFPPQRILQIEGDKLKPLRELEESLREGKDLLRRSPAAQFRVAGGLIEIESPETSGRNVVLFERDPLVRVAARRTFDARGMKIAQFGSLDETREAIAGFIRSNSFFVTILEITDDSDALLQFIKRRNSRLPVAMVDSGVDLRRRHELLEAGANLYLARPARERLRPEVADEELNLFADELVLFADGAFAQWEEISGVLGAEAGRRFYEEGQREHLERSFHLLQQLISELSDPNDITEVSATILRFSAEYVDRCVLFIINEDHFVGVGGFGIAGGGETINERARKLRIPRDAPSIFSEVADSREMHCGKLRRTEANSELIDALGGLLPTEVLVFPIMHGGQTIGILYGDNAEHRGPIDMVTGLEIFLAQAAYSLHNAMAASQKE